MHTLMALGGYFLISLLGALLAARFFGAVDERRRP